MSKDEEVFTNSTYQKIRYLINCYKNMGGATSEDLMELTYKLSTDMEFLQAELDATTWNEEELSKNLLRG